MESQYLLKRRAQMLGLKEPEPKKEQKPIAKKSVKLKDADKEYKKLRKQYLAVHIKCEVKGCNHVATEIHHMKTRAGKFLTDANYFLAVCRDCHTKITENSAWAIQQGYSISKHSNNDNNGK